MRAPSRNLKKHMNTMIGEKDYLNGVRKDVELGRIVSEGMVSKFGVLLLRTLEELERACYASLTTVSPYRVFAQVQIRAELKTVQYIKARLESYIQNAEALLQNARELEDEGY